jgi:hypothetical protein
VRVLGLGAAAIALVAALAGVLAIARAPERTVAAMGAGRRLAVGALATGAVGALLAVPAVRVADQPLAGAGALVAAAPTRWWTVVLALAALGWGLGAVARRAAARPGVGPRRARPVRRRRTRAEARAAIEARQQARDAFFGDPSGPAGPRDDAPDDPGPDADGPHADGPDAGDGRPDAPSIAAAGPVPPASGARSADQERAEALAADRRVALERIDGTSASPLRTNRGR